jgi:peptidoglycan/LPS O-acetylase OafA/YrhL
MFGYLRLFLAILVLISHLNIKPWGLDVGVISVVFFLMLAGYVVTDLLTRVFEPDEKLILRFYAERCLRIFPMYLYCLGLTVVFLLVTGFGKPIFDPVHILSNALIVPLDYFMFFNNSILQEPSAYLVPPAWSLGLEVQAYFVLGIIISSKLAKNIAGIASLTLFAVINLFAIQPNYFGYRLLPSTLFIFVLGNCIYKITKSKDSNRVDRAFPLICTLTMLLCDIILVAFRHAHLGVVGHLTIGHLTQSYTSEISIGIFLGIPCICYVSASNLKLPFNRLLGDLSYGVFLSQYIGIWLLTETHSEFELKSFGGFFAVLSISLFISFLGVFLIEKPIFKYRKRLTKPFKIAILVGS